MGIAGMVVRIGLEVGLPVPSWPRIDMANRNLF
jgi:hypothetical protein